MVEPPVPPVRPSELLQPDKRVAARIVERLASVVDLIGVLAFIATSRMRILRAGAGALACTTFSCATWVKPITFA